MPARRAEDVEACRRLGAEPLHLDLPEAPYRVDERGEILYASLGALFGAVAAADEVWVERIATRLEELGEEAEIVGPLGVGHHVDHQLVRRALERVRPRAAFYEEFPYTEWKWLALRRALGRTSEWRAEVLPIDDALYERRRRAILAYASQVPALFRTEARLGKQLRRALRRAGGERIWRRR
jgi:hypothetical protein